MSRYSVTLTNSASIPSEAAASRAFASRRRQLLQPVARNSIFYTWGVPPVAGAAAAAQWMRALNR